jgi:outer membrane protein assembly factor BamB
MGDMKLKSSILMNPKEVKLNLLRKSCSSTNLKKSVCHIASLFMPRVSDPGYNNSCEFLQLSTSLKRARTALTGVSCLLLVCVLGTFGGASSLYAADDWPQFRGPTGQGISTATDVPLEWSSTKNVKWKTEIPGRGWSSPVLSRGRVYLTTAISRESEPISLRALAVDASNGEILWNVEVFSWSAPTKGALHSKNSLASPTPIVQGERIYVHFGHMGTAALGLEGKILWSQRNLSYEPVHGNGGSPVLVGDSLIFSCDAAQDPFVAALDSKTGKLLWKTPRNTPAQRTFSFSTPLEIEVDGIKQIISPGSGLVAAYDPAGGKEIWRVRYGEGYSVVPRPVYAQGLLFISSGYDAPELLVIRPDGAKGDVTESHVAWSTKRGAPNTPSVLVVDDLAYYVSDAGIATCADAKTGKVHWTERLGGNFSASPFYAEGRIYFQNEEGVGFVVKHSQTFKLLAKNDLEEQTLASCAVMNTKLFIRSKSHLWCIGQ